MDDQHANQKDSRLYALFLDESRMHLGQLSAGLDALAHDPGSADVLQELFRAAHSLKGGCAVIGYTALATLLHRAEDLLGDARTGARTLTPPLQALLVRVRRHVADTLDALAHDAPADDAALAALADELVAARAAPAETAAPEDARRRTPLGALPEEHVALLVNFRDDCAMPGVRAFLVLRALDKVGRVCDTVPARALINGKMQGHRLLVVLDAPADRDTLTAAVKGVGEVAWVRVARGPLAAGMWVDMPSREAARAGTPAHDEHAFIRVDASQLAALTELSARVTAAAAAALPALAGELQALHAAIDALHTVPATELLARMPRLVQDTCLAVGKEVELHLEGEDVPLHRTLPPLLADPLLHLVRNAIDHGIEAPDARVAAGKAACGTLHLAVQAADDVVRITVRDDGAGIDTGRVLARARAAGLVAADAALADAAIYRLLFAPGFSTAAAVTELSGRGVGLDVVLNNVEERLGGRVEIASTPGQGTAFTLVVPRGGARD
jgi:two-component system chemotaxis sensor kinase CheA